MGATPSPSSPCPGGAVGLAISCTWVEKGGQSLPKFLAGRPGERVSSGASNFHPPNSTKTLHLSKLVFSTLSIHLRYAKVGHRPQLCHPACPGVPWDRSGLGFPTSRYRPRRRMRLSVLKAARGFANATKLDRKSGVA
jgi:hypothetical protein